MLSCLLVLPVSSVRTMITLIGGWTCRSAEHLDKKKIRRTRQEGLIRVPYDRVAAVCTGDTGLSIPAAVLNLKMNFRQLTHPSLPPALVNALSIRISIIM